MELGADGGAGLREGNLGFQGRAGIEPIPAPVPSSPWPWHGCCALVTLTSPAPRACHCPSSPSRDPITSLLPPRDNGVPEQGSSVPKLGPLSSDNVLCQCWCLIIPNAARGGGAWKLLDVGKGKLSRFRAPIPAQDTQDIGTGDTVQAVPLARRGHLSRQPKGRTQNCPRSLVREESSGKALGRCRFIHRAIPRNSSRTLGVNPATFVPLHAGPQSHHCPLCGDITPSPSWTALSSLGWLSEADPAWNGSPSSIWYKEATSHGF